jgi:hypothetical protein
MKFKTHNPKLPLSIYIVFGLTVVANVAATIIVLKYFIR